VKYCEVGPLQDGAGDDSNERHYREIQDPVTDNAEPRVEQVLFGGFAGFFVMRDFSVDEFEFVSDESWSVL
jgi:hypothetical protein